MGRAGNARTAVGHLLLLTGIWGLGDIALISLHNNPLLVHTDPAVARYGSRTGKFLGVPARIVEKLAQGAAVGREVRLLAPDLIRRQTLE